MFLSAFGATGIAIQWLSLSVFGFALPGSFLVLPAIFVAIPFTRASGLLVAKAIPKDESEAVSQREFIGKIATIIRGQAKRGQPAEAKVTDSHGMTHYLLVEPDDANEEFDQHDEIIVVGKVRTIYRVVRNPNPVLSPEQK